MTMIGSRRSLVIGSSSVGEGDLAALKGERQFQLEGRFLRDAVEAAERVLDDPALGDRVLDRRGRADSGASRPPIPE
jgi:hypothetical protein